MARQPKAETEPTTAPDETPEVSPTTVEAEPAPELTPEPVSNRAAEGADVMTIVIIDERGIWAPTQRAAGDVVSEGDGLTPEQIERLINLGFARAVT